MQWNFFTIYILCEQLWTWKFISTVENYYTHPFPHHISYLAIMDLLQITRATKPNKHGHGYNFNSHSKWHRLWGDNAASELSRLPWCAILASHVHHYICIVVVAHICIYSYMCVQTNKQTHTQTTLNCEHIKADCGDFCRLNSTLSVFCLAIFQNWVSTQSNTTSNECDERDGRTNEQ